MFIAWRLQIVFVFLVQKNIDWKCHVLKKFLKNPS